ncbi:MAG: DUF4330 domain-containing protein [Clostridia bacterium]|nr:DUF4330 domain-containing protein [Clostridia bacterium]
MRLIDEKGRLFGKINIVDLCVVLVLLLAVAAFFVKDNSVAKTDKTAVPVEYTVLIRSVRQPTVDGIENSIGKSATVTKTGELLGEIKEVTKSEAEAYISSKDGEYIKTVFPDKYDLTVTITTQGSENAKGIYTAGGKQILVGENLKISTDSVETAGEVIEIK